MSGSQRGSRIGRTTLALSCNWSPRAPLLRTCWCGAHASALPPKRRTPVPAILLGGAEGGDVSNRGGGVIGLQPTLRCHSVDFCCSASVFGPQTECASDGLGTSPPACGFSFRKDAVTSPAARGAGKGFALSADAELPWLWLLSTCS